MVPKGPLKRPATAKPEGCTILKVKELMNQEGEGWNKELVKNLFSHAEATTILSIPVSSLGMKTDWFGYILLADNIL